MELTFWAGWSLSKDDPRGKFITDALDAFQKENPHIKVTPVTQPFAKYDEIFQSALVSNSGPDVAAVLPGDWMDKFMAAWKPLTLSDAEKQAMVDLPSVSQKFDPNSGTYYAIPWGIEVFFFYYNKSLFKQAGLDPEKPPATWDDLTAACAKLKAAHITPLAFGAKGGAALNHWMQEGMAQLMDPGDGARMARGEILATDPRIAGMFKRTVDYVQNCAQEGYRTMPLVPDPIDYMAAGKAAMVVGWLSRMVYVDKGLGTGNFGIFPFPALPDAKHPGCVAAGAGGANAATKWSKHPAEAEKLAKFLSTAPMQQKMLTDLTIIPGRKDFDTSGVQWPPMKQGLQWLSSGCNVSPLVVWHLPQEASAELYKQFELVLAGETTSDKALLEVDKVIKQVTGK